MATFKSGDKEIELDDIILNQLQQGPSDLRGNITYLKQKLREIEDLYLYAPVTIIPNPESVGVPVIQPWLINLGLRYQGVIVAAIRGCDVAPKEDTTKMIVRAIRQLCLVPFDRRELNRKGSFMFVDRSELYSAFENFHQSRDHYPSHYVSHMTHAVEIIGYHHPDNDTREYWESQYIMLCAGWHMNPETREQLHKRMTRLKVVS